MRDPNKEKLEEKGYTTVLDALLLVGTYGTWDPKNDPLLKQLGIGREYGNLLKKLCCRDAISGMTSGHPNVVGIFAGRRPRAPKSKLYTSLQFSWLRLVPS